MNQTLEIELQVPLSWEPTAAPATPTDNHAAFLLINGFADTQVSRGEEETETGDLQRIEQKLDLIVQLLMPLLRQSQQLPSTQALRLSASHIAWHTEQGPHVGQVVKLNLFVEPRVPYPLVLYASVTQCENAWVQARFEQLSETDAEALERWIFRYHRRQVAQQRQRS